MPGSVTTRDDPILDKYLIMRIMLECWLKSGSVREKVCVGGGIYLFPYRLRVKRSSRQHCEHFQAVIQHQVSIKPALKPTILCLSGE